MGVKRVSCGCLEGALLESGGCLECVWRLSFRCLEGVLLVSGGCLVGVWRVSCRCLEGVYSATFPRVHSNKCQEWLSHRYTC